MVLASQASSFTIGLLVTFLGIGVIVNGLVVYIAALVFGERTENQRARDHR